jgi:hypothetical protein
MLKFANAAAFVPCVFHWLSNQRPGAEGASAEVSYALNHAHAYVLVPGPQDMQ